jgi:hypothetical protein
MKAIRDLAKNIAYQYTALQLIMNAEYWMKEAKEDDFNDMAYEVVLQLAQLGLIEDFIF